MKAVRIQRTGGPEVLEYVDVPTPTPGIGEVLVKVEWVGVGMPDVMVRSGTYPWMPPLPAVIGSEAAGRVVAVGDGVQSPALGTAVLVSARELPARANCYAEFIRVPAQAVYPLPAGVDLAEACCLFNYQLAWHLLHSATQGYRFETVLVWAAAGGVGSALVQLARHHGKYVVAVAGGTEKCRQALGHGADACIDYRSEDVGDRLQALTGGRGVDLVLDPVGGPDFKRCFDYLAPLGLVVSYGRLQGPPDPSYAQVMQERVGKSPGVRFFSIHVFDEDCERRRSAMQEVIPLLAEGRLRPHIGTRMPLRDARKAHELLEGGKASGKLLLQP